MKEGWIKLHRKFLDWEGYSNLSVRVLFLHILLKANYQDTEEDGLLIPRGSLLTSLSELAQETGLSIQSVRTALGKMELTRELTRESTRGLTRKVTHKNTLITICKYEAYQSLPKEANTQINTQGNTQINTPSNISIINKEEYKNIKEEKEKKSDKRFSPPSLEEVKALVAERGYTFEPMAFFSYYASRGWTVGRGNAPMKDWRSALTTWQIRENQFKSKLTQENRNNNATYTSGQSPADSEQEFRDHILRRLSSPEPPEPDIEGYY